MVLEINEAFTTVLIVTDENGNPASGKTISYRLFDESFNLEESGSMSELGVYGIYYKTWTPNADGYWIFEAYYTGSDFKFYDIKMYPVEKGEEHDLEHRIGDPLSDTLTSLTAKMGNLSVNLATILQVFTAAETGNLGARFGFIQQHIAKGSGTVLPSNKSLYDVIALDRLDHATYGLSALNTDLDTIIANIGNFQGQTNLRTILAVLGVPDTAGKPLYTVLVTDRLDNATFGLSALNTDLDTLLSRVGDPTGHTLTSLVAKMGNLSESLQAILEVFSASESGGMGDRMAFIQQHIAKGVGTALPSDKSLYDVIALDRLDNGTYGLSALQTLLAGLENKLKAAPSVNSILFKSGGAVCPSGKSLWDALGDASVSLNTLNNLLTNGTYGLAALEDLVDEVETLLKDAGYGLSALNTDLDTLISRLGDPTGHTLTSVIAKLGNNTTAIGTVTDRLYSLVQATGAVTGTPTPNFFDTNLTEATDDHYNGMILIFTSGNLAGQASIIVDYNGTTKEITVDPAFIETPSTDNFVIVSNAIGKLGTKSKGMDQIYDLIDAIFELMRTGGTLTADGTEQYIYVNDAPSKLYAPRKVQIDLTNLALGDTIVVKEYYRLKSGGSYVLKDQRTYKDAQSIPLVDVELTATRFGIKVTLQQTGGTNRNFDWESFFDN